MRYNLQSLAFLAVVGTGGIAACSDAAGPASVVSITAGNEQTAAAGTTLPTLLRVKVTDADSKAVQSTTVTWLVTAGGGSLSATESVSDVDGVASITWTLGTTLGTQTVTATVGTLAPVTFTANAI